MTLSITKLDKLLTKYNFSIKKIFTMDDKCVYIEALSNNTAELFMIYIPSKYEIQVNRADNVFSLKYLEINEDGTVPANYAGEPDGFELDQKYGNLDLPQNTHIETENMEEHLQENYNHALSLKDINKKDLNELRDIFRQLKRLGFSVQSLGYKLCIVYDKYLCCIRRDDTFEGFIVPYLRGNKQRKLYVSIDLETLYKKFESISVDINTIKQGIQRLLNKNHYKHTSNLNNMLEFKDNFSQASREIIARKEKYSVYLLQLETMLANLNKAEKANNEKILDITTKYDKDSSVKGLHTDIQKTHELSKYNLEIQNISDTKQDIIHNILNIRTILENISLKLDKICFDNTVMLDAIIKNFKLLGQI